MIQQLLKLLLLLLLLTVPCRAQSHINGSGDSPCRYGLGEVGQGRIEPRHPGVICLPTLGEMTGSKPISTHLTTVYPVGDVDRDGLSDWILTTKPDTIVNGGRPGELRLYRGVRGRLPSLESGERIGLSERGSDTYLVAAGDWNADAWIDLVVKASIFGDTTGGNTEGLEVGAVVVFWGGSSGYSLNDTTRLENGEQTWLGLGTSISADVDGDSIQDVVMWVGSGMTNGKIIPKPAISIFRGHRGKRWGQDGIARTADLGWWKSPTFRHFSAIDQNCDGYVDIVFYDDDEGVSNAGSISVLYGTTGGGLPDTTNLITVNLQPVSGHAALLSDISGDGVPELIVSALDEFMHIYAGEPGVKIDQQFGTGSDEPDPDHGRWYRRPWATFPLPRRLHDGWSFSGALAPLDLGDANLDGLNDIFTRNWPFLIEYNTGSLYDTSQAYIDSLIDGMYRAPHDEIRGAVRIGDVDGSGVAAIAVTYFPNGVAFIKPTTDLPQSGEPRKLLHEPGIRCTSISSVDEAATEPGGTTSKLQITATPNPATGEVLLQWSGDELHGEVTLTVHDMLGRELTKFSAQAIHQSARWNAAGLPGGRYYITLTIGRQSTTMPLVILR
jgi:hypothetical protein